MMVAEWALVEVIVSEIRGGSEVSGRSSIVMVVLVLVVLVVVVVMLVVKVVAMVELGVMVQ